MLCTRKPEARQWLCQCTGKSAEGMSNEHGAAIIEYDCERRIQAGELLQHCRRSAAYTVVLRVGHLDGAANVGNSVELSHELPNGFEIADDLIGCVADSLRDQVPCRV